jgi:hypothetical protein
MPLKVPKIFFDPDGKPLTVELRFPTRQVVSYTLTLFEAGSNSVVICEKGNDVNPEDDKYTLPTPPKVNDGRYLQVDATFVDPAGKPNASCRAEALVKQGATLCGTLVIDGTLTGTSFSGTDFAQLAAK